MPPFDVLIPPPLHHPSTTPPPAFKKAAALQCAHISPPVYLYTCIPVYLCIEQGLEPLIGC